MELSRKDVQSLIIQRAWKDDSFRSEFLGDPKTTIEKYTERRLPAEIRIFAHAEDDSTAHFVIPPKPANADELSEEDLEKIAGGVDVIVGITAAVIIGGAIAGSGAYAGTKVAHGW